MLQRAATDDLRDETAIRALMQSRASQSLKTAMVIAASLCVLLYTLLDRAPLPNLFLWIAIMLAITLWRGLQSAAILKRVVEASAAQLRRQEFSVLANGVLGSYAMGSAFWLIALHGDLYVKLVITLLSVIYISGGLVHPTPVSHRVLRATGSVGQGALFWLGVGSSDPPHWEILAAYSGFVLMLFEFAREHQRQFRESLRIRNENAALLLQLEKEKEIIESALQEAKLANESKSRFLAAASHDLRQPLHALTMFLGTLTFHVTTDEAKRLLGRIKDTAGVLEEQFNSLLDLSKFDVGAFAAEICPFRLNRLAEKLVEEFRQEAEAKHLVITAATCEAIAHSDPSLIERLLSNLIANAVKYTTSGSVVVRVEQQDAGYRVEVIDTGAGIPIDQQERIFEEYVQLANPARQRRHGVGLGLAIVKRIDVLLKLDLALQSQVGLGSRFSFYVPRAPVTELAEQQERTVIDTTRFRTSATIWILDDDADVLESLCEQLTAWGAQVEMFSHPEALLQRLRSGAVLPQWLLTDDMLGPALSGLETAQILSSEFGFGNVCLLTGNTDPQRLLQLRSSGFPVIVKPAKPENLMAIIGN